MPKSPTLMDAAMVALSGAVLLLIALVLFGCTPKETDLRVGCEYDGKPVLETTRDFTASIIHLAEWPHPLAPSGTSPVPPVEIGTRGVTVFRDRAGQWWAVKPEACVGVPR